MITAFTIKPQRNRMAGTLVARLSSSSSVPG